MARRPDPERLYLAHRAGIASRLVSQARLSPAAAERWITAWEAEAAQRGLARHSDVYWRPAWDWITDRRRVDAGHRD